VKTHKEMNVKYLLLLSNCNQNWNIYLFIYELWFLIGPEDG